MTQAEAKKLLPVIQAFAEGKTIQFRRTAEEFNGEPWQNAVGQNYNFDAQQVEWRVKRVPCEFWIAIGGPAGRAVVCVREDDPLLRSPVVDGWKVVDRIRVREVIEGE